MSPGNLVESPKKRKRKEGRKERTSFIAFFCLSEFVRGFIFLEQESRKTSEYRPYFLSKINCWQNSNKPNYR
jgi:hypothetical protein